MRCIVAGLRTWVIARNTCLLLAFVLVACAETWREPPADWTYRIYYVASPKTVVAMDSARKNLHALLNDRSARKSFQFHDNRGGIGYKTAVVHSDNVVFSNDIDHSVTLMFEELADREISVENFWAYSPNDRGINFRIEVAGLANFYAVDLDMAKRLADAIYSIAYNVAATHQAEFEAQAARYRALPIKPEVTEEQRKFIVQANALSQQKAYADALEAYNKALAIDPVSYPAAYFNMALLSAQENRFQSAIGYMKKYLFLEPNAGDARSAQDKIYEWELMISRQK